MPIPLTNVRRHEALLTAGQTSGGIKEIMPVAEIIRQLTAEAETVLSPGPSFTLTKKSVGGNNDVCSWQHSSDVSDQTQGLPGTP